MYICIHTYIFTTTYAKCNINEVYCWYVSKVHMHQRTGIPEGRSRLTRAKLNPSVV